MTEEVPVEVAPTTPEEQDPPEQTSKGSLEETDEPVTKLDDAEENKIEEEDTVAAGEAERVYNEIKTDEKPAA